MEKSLFFTSLNGDRRYKSSDFAEYFKTFIDNGVFPNPSTNLQATANEDMTVTILPGYAWINGYMYANTDSLNLIIENSDSVLNRIDRVVVRLDFLNREIKTYVKKGSFATNPIAPNIQRDADVFELAIADININAGAIKITQSDIKDLRLNKEVCGIVKGTIDEIDTTTLYKQLEAYIEEKSLDMQTWIENNKEGFLKWITEIKEKFENDFNTWFEDIKGTFEEDVVGNILAKIEKNTNDIRELDTKLNDKLSVELEKMQGGLMDIYIELLLLQEITQKGMKYNVFYENFETIDDIELVSGAYNKENNYIYM